MIRRVSLFTLLTAVAITVSLGAAGCKSAQKSDDSSVIDNTGAAADDNTLGDSDSGKAMGLQTIYFPYDAFNLDETAKDTLKSNAQILKDKKSARIQIEGHCDTRGGIQYNIALGEKRAAAVKKYLTGIGIADDRVTTISYGKERLLDSGGSDSAHSKNRRANFVVTAR